MAWALAGGGVLLAGLLVILREPALGWLASGLPPSMRPAAAGALVWSALALPAALLAALWATRLQHERDFAGMYSSNLVVNAVLIAAIWWAGSRGAGGAALTWLGAGLLAAMLLRLAWLRWRGASRVRPPAGSSHGPGLPAAPVWLWAILSAGLPLALPFAARSIASQAGEGELATFNYAWKLVELPLVLAIQLVATLAFPAIARATAGGQSDTMAGAVRSAIALSWALACAAASALVVGAPAIARLLFGWGRMEPQALDRVAQWGALGAWGLLPQALIAVALTVLASRGRMKFAVIAYALALGILLAYGARGQGDGASLMTLLNLLFAGVAVAVVAALGPQGLAWLPWRSMALSLAVLLAVSGLAAQAPVASTGLAIGLLSAAAAGLAVMGVTWWGSSDLRAALAR